MTNIPPVQPAPVGVKTVMVPLYILRPGDLVMWFGMVRTVAAMDEFANPNWHRGNDGQGDMFYGHRTLCRVTFSEALRPYAVQGGSTDGIAMIRRNDERTTR
jgi:hypothetical protein